MLPAIPSTTDAPRIETSRAPEVAGNEARSGWFVRISGSFEDLRAGKTERFERLIATVLGAIVLVAFVAAPYPPMVDVPQHAAQIATWQRLADPASPEAQLYVLNLRTPYLVGYALARAFATWTGPVLALKLVAALAALAHAYAYAFFVRRLGYPRWLELLGFPLAFGYAFYFGFVSFLVGFPLLYLSTVAALTFRERPTPKSGAVLSALLVATLVAHGFVFGLTCAFVAPLLLRGGKNLAIRFSPFLGPLLVGAAWLAPGSSVRAIGATLWSPRGRELLGSPALLFGSSGADHVAVGFGYVALALVAASLSFSVPRLERAAPLAFVLGGFCFFPLSLGGFGPLHPRFAALFVPALLLAFEPKETRPASRLGWLALALAASWSAVFVLRLARFQREMRPIEDLIATLPSGLRMRAVMFDRESRNYPSLPALLHASAYYAVEKGGRQGYSFAMYPTSVVRYAPSVVPAMQGGAEWHPEWFSVDAELPDYDVFVVRGSEAQAQRLFGERHDVSLDFQEDDVWAYRVAGSKAWKGSRP